MGIGPYEKILPWIKGGRVATGALRPRNDIFTYTLHTPYITLCKHPLHQEQQAEAGQAQDADEEGIEPV